MNKIKELVGESWYEKLKPFFDSQDFQNILKELKRLKDKGRIIRPKFENTFINLKHVPFDKVKVVMLMNIGMDKSQNDQIADAIVDAIKADTGESPVNIWKTPLVLLLPLNITTCDGENHTDLWKPFIVAVMKALQSKPGLIYCYIGKDSQSHVLAVDQTCNDFHYIEHPMQAIMNNRPWNYKNVFEKINRASNFLNDEKIKWS